MTSLDLALKVAGQQRRLGSEVLTAVNMKADVSEEHITSISQV
jgi:hypothetical protein